ncbi:hypothetical protein CPC08DRAFT_330600 [Agrocybe pediades]|nr:hypothetical protein CPC08DRAFT_330600 [Agrocybe pediades]
MTTQTNSTFTMNFTGVSVTWYGVVFPKLPNSPARGSYVVNGESPHAFQLEGLSPGEVTQYNQIFFQTPPYNQGQHTMVVTYLGNTNTTPLTLDYLIIQNGTQLRNATASPTSSTHTLGPVVGGVLGGIALVILTAVGFILYRRRKKKNGKTTQPASGSESIVQPFQYVAPNATTSQFLASSVQGSQALNSKTRTRGEGTNVASTSVAPNRSRMIMDEGPANHHPQRVSMTDVSEMPPSYSDL